MKTNSGWGIARGQITWIFALVVSTGIVIQLERFDFAGQVDALQTNPFAVDRTSALAALEQTRVALNAQPDSEIARSGYLIALCVAKMSGAGETSALRDEASALLAEMLPGEIPDGALMTAAVALAQAVFFSR